MDNEIRKDTDTVEQDHDQEQPKNEKLFTQAEVDEVIKKRLQRADKVSAKKEFAAIEEAQKQMEEREKALQAKETYLQCKEYLISEDLPTDLLDAVDVSDFEQFKKKVGILNKYVERSRPRAPLGSTEPRITGGLSKPFSPDYKHKPKDPFRGY